VEPGRVFSGQEREDGDEDLVGQIDQADDHLSLCSRSLLLLLVVVEVLEC
jgi:hypothetical protein